MFKVERLDHLVLTVQDIERTCAFYERALGMRRVAFGNGRLALVFGQQKINLHQAGKEIDPKAWRPIPGSADLCFITSSPLADVIASLHQSSVDILDGPVPRTGALGPIQSVYFRDPDLNLIEISTYTDP